MCHKILDHCFIHGVIYPEHRVISSILVRPRERLVPASPGLNPKHGADPMPEATTTPTTRRAAFGMAAFLPLAGIAAAPNRPPSPDAELIAMCSEYLANEVEYERIEEPYWYQPGPRALPSPADEATLSALIECNRCSAPGC